MQKFLKRYMLWIFYAAFLIFAMYFGGREGLLTTDSQHSAAKTIVLVIYIAFLAYSLLATQRENFFRTLRTVNGLWWGRQIGLDLYISVFLSLALIWYVEGSVLILALWLIPVLIFANLAILPYVLLNFAEIMGHFAAS